MNRDKLLIEVLRKAGHGEAADLAAAVIEHRPAEEETETTTAEKTPPAGKTREQAEAEEAEEMMAAIRDLPGMAERLGVEA